MSVYVLTTQTEVLEEWLERRIRFPKRLLPLHRGICARNSKQSVVKYKKIKK